VKKSGKATPVIFVIVGSTAAAVHLLTALAMVELVGIAPGWANVIGFCSAFMVSYLGHRRYTFGVVGNIAASFRKWLIVSLCGFALNQILFLTALDFFPETYYFELLFAVTAIVAVASYCLGKFWAFLPVKHEPASTSHRH
jgi:putative flippase GtrA